MRLVAEWNLIVAPSGSILRISGDCMICYQITANSDQGVTVQRAIDTLDFETFQTLQTGDTTDILMYDFDGSVTLHPGKHCGSVTLHPGKRCMCPSLPTQRRFWNSCGKRSGTEIFKLTKNLSE